MSAHTTTIGSFTSVDEAPEAAGLIVALDEIAQLPAVQRLNAVALELLAPQAGQRLVDVGCGTGDDVRALAAAVGPTGLVIGIDPSATMIEEAMRRSQHGELPIEFRLGDAAHLDLADASVDGCRCERVFQHLDDPAAAMSELVRVTRPGGRIVVIDTDWGMHAVHGADPELTERVLRAWVQTAANGLSGRRLPGLFIQAGVPDPLVVAETFVLRDAARPLLPPFTLMADAARHAGAVTPDEADSWIEQLVAAAARGQFFWAATMFAVAGLRST